jgi:hypothetical protein
VFYGNTAFWQQSDRLGVEKIVLSAQHYLTAAGSDQ